MTETHVSNSKQVTSSPHWSVSLPNKSLNLFHHFFSLQPFHSLPGHLSFQREKKDLSVSVFCDCIAFTDKKTESSFVIVNIVKKKLAMCNKNITTTTTTTSPAKSIMKKKKKKPQQKNSNNKISSSSVSSTSTSLTSSSSSSLKPLKRKNIRKKKKPKFLSLRLQLSQTLNEPKKTSNQENQVNLFTESENPEENNVALLFSSDGGGTLNGLLEDESTTVTAATSDDGSLSAMTVPTMEGLVRKAMRRGRSDEGSEERWVCYSEVTSSTVETTSFGSLSLKLDHEGILNAWSDKGSLYVDGEDAPQTVPDLFDASFLHHPLHPNVAWDVVGNTWKVPEISEADGLSVKEEVGWKLGQREASVLRYKEKRRNRLFAKRIRYEVRKLNAEKRPRMKGRFVKRE